MSNLIKLTRAELREMYRDGETPFGLLNEAVMSGYEYPDALAMVADIAHLDKEGIDELELDYDECC